jgi:hypothetical protein
MQRWWRAALVLSLVGAPVAFAGPPPSTIGTNGLRMPDALSTYRVTLRGEIALVGRAPTLSTTESATVSPDGRWRLERVSSGASVRNTQTGETFAVTRSGSAWWARSGRLAVPLRMSGGGMRLELLDPATRTSHTVARQICGTGGDPWSPDRTRLAVAVAAPGQGCRGEIATRIISDADANRDRLPWPGRYPLAWSRDGQHVLLASLDGPAALVDVRTGGGEPVFAAFTHVGSVTWSADRRFATISGIDAAHR